MWDLGEISFLLPMDVQLFQHYFWKKKKIFPLLNCFCTFVKILLAKWGYYYQFKKNKKNYKIILSTDKLDKLGYMSKFLEKHITKIDSRRNRKSE